MNKLRLEIDEHKMTIDELNRKSQGLIKVESDTRNNKLSQEIERLNLVLEGKNKEVANLGRRLQEIDEMNKSIGSLQEKIKKLTSENYSIEEEMRSAQENLRLSANQNAKMAG